MSFVTKLTSKIRFWTGGPILRNASGVIEARNAADSAYAIVRGATAVGNSDLAPKAYVDTAIDTDITAALKDTTFQDSTDPTKEATLDLSGITTATERTIVVPDTDITLCDAVDPVFNDGVDQTKQANLVLSGITTGNNRALTIPDKDITIAGTADITTAVAAALLSNVEVRTVQLAYTDTGDNNIAAAVPDGAICAVVLVQVTTTFDGTTPVLKVGDSGDDDRFMLTTDSDLGTAGLYQKATIYTFSGATQLVANLTIGGSPSQGACDIVVLFARAIS